MGVVWHCIHEALEPLLLSAWSHACVFMNEDVPVCIDVQTLEELSLCVLSRLEEVVKEKHHWREITEAHVQLLRDFAFQEWLCSQSLEHYYHT